MLSRFSTLQVRSLSLLKGTTLSRGLATYYTKDHEWVSVKGKVATIGITDHAQQELGDVVYVGLPDVGAAFKAGQAFGSVESVKAASDVYAPISGTVSEVNTQLADNTSLVNTAAESDGWFVKFKIGNEKELAGLMNKEKYEEFVKAHAH